MNDEFTYHNRKFSDLIENFLDSKDPFCFDVIKRAKDFFRTKEKARKLEFALNFAYELLSDLSANDVEVYSLVLRGSYGRLKPEENDDIDYVIFSKRSQSLNTYVNTRKSKFEKIVGNVKKRLSYKIHSEKDLVLSFFFPLVPWDSRKRFEFFLYNPSEVEIRTYYAQFPNKSKKTYNYLKYVCSWMDICLSLDTGKSLSIVEKVRLKDYEKFGISREDARGVSIIFDARVAGLIFCKEKVSQPRDSSLKNKIIQFVFPELCDKIKETL